MRSRNIKPAFFKNEDLAELSPHARLLFIGLWCLADVQGRLQDRPNRIRAEIFGYEPDIKIDQLLNELAQSHGRFINRYQINEERFIEITGFTKHQSPCKKEKDAGSRIPSPVLDRGKSSDPVPTQIDPSSDPVQLITDVLITDIPLTGAEANASVPAIKKQESEHFEQFWKIYPRKVNRQGCLTFWMKNNLDQEAETIIASVQRHSVCEQWKAQNGQFIPHPLTFLRQERYLDLSMDVPSIAPIPANALLEEKRAKRDALLNFPYIRLEGSLVESTRFSVDDAFPDRLYAFGCSYDISLLEGVSANE